MLEAPPIPKTDKVPITLPKDKTLADLNIAHSQSPQAEDALHSPKQSRLDNAQGYLD